MKKITQEIFVLPADNHIDRKIGFLMTENLGIGVVNPRAVQRLNIIRVDCPVCKENVYDLSKHALSKNDDEHKVLAVLET